MVLVAKKHCDDEPTAQYQAQLFRNRLNYCSDVQYEVVQCRNVVEIYRKGNLHVR